MQLAPVSRIASGASFGTSRGHALPAAQRAASRCLGLPGAPRGHDDLGLHGPPGSDATMMRLIPLRGVHHRCGCWYRDASGSSRLHRCITGGPGERCPAGTAAARNAPGLPHHWPRHAPDLATSRSRCTSCIPAPRRRTFPQPSARPSARPHATRRHAPTCPARVAATGSWRLLTWPCSTAGEIHTCDHQPGSSLQAPPLWLRYSAWSEHCSLPV